MTNLPIHAIIPEVIDHLAHHACIIVQAPPGAGKSTGLPLALLDRLAQGSQIWLLEPRRLAAQQVAQRLSMGLNEKLGLSVGLMTGDQSNVSKHNRIVVMTEAILTQRLINEPDIPRCQILVFDEYHERNLHTDLGLALALQCQSYLRDDLTLVIMSATLDTHDLAKKLNSPVISSEGKQFNVAIEYLPQSAHATTALADQVKKAIDLALLNEQYNQGDVLAFLPGVKEIKQCERLLSDHFSSSINNNLLAIHELHGQLNPEQQNKIFSHTHQQHIILATDIAKTSLTLPKVTIVIDSGLERTNQFNLRMGMDELVTLQASQATAIQRTGRAGRVQAGICYRLYSEDAFKRRAPFSPHAIERSDLAPFTLALAAWGNLALDDYIFLTPPNPKSYASSIELLEQLNILNDNQLSAHGKQLAPLGLHPRLSHMIVKAVDLNIGYDACMLAALLSEGDPLWFDEPNSDAFIRMQLFERKSIPAYFENAKVNIKKAKRIIQSANKFSRLLNITPVEINSDHSGLLLMLAYPDRVGQKRGKGYRLRNGLGCELHYLDALDSTDFLAVAHVSHAQSHTNQQPMNSTIRLACYVSQQQIEKLFFNQIDTRQIINLNEKQQLQTIERVCLGEIILKETITSANSAQKKSFYLQTFKQKGIDFLPLDSDQKKLLLRLQLAHATYPDIFIAFTEQVLIDQCDQWLAPFLTTTDFHKIDYGQALLSRLDWKFQQTLNEYFPLYYELPTTRRAIIDYSETPPVVRAKLQECFGLKQSPTIAQGRITLNVHLLSPAQRPLAMTQDLAFFWQHAYPDVRKENRGRYAKHPWPEDPINAIASGLTKKRIEKNK